LDMPGPNHRLVLDFAGAQVDKMVLPSPEALAVRIAKDAPAVKGVRYTNLPNAAKPTARIVVDLPENLKVTPRVVRLEESGVVISLGDEFQNATAAPDAANAATRATEPVATAPADAAPAPGADAPATGEAAAAAPVAAAASETPAPVAVA